MRTRLAGAVVLAALAGGATAQPPRKVAAVSHCAAGEATVYSCRFGRSLGSVCGSAGRVAYRFGPPGKPALEIVSAPDWSNVRLGRVTGGGGGYQNHLRFSANGHDYLVHEAVAGELTDILGQSWSGIVVQRGQSEIASLDCRGKPILAPGGLGDVSRFAPEGLREALADDDPRFDAWF